MTAVVVVRFRKYWPYNGGVATDLLDHKLAPLLITLAGPDGAYPTRVSAGGGLYVEQDDSDIPVPVPPHRRLPQFSVLLVSKLTNDTQRPDRVDGKHGTMDLPQTLFAIVLLATPQVKGAGNERTEKDKADEWVLRFDGKTLDGWTTSAGQPSKTPVENGSTHPHKCGALHGGPQGSVGELRPGDRLQDRQGV